MAAHDIATIWRLPLQSASPVIIVITGPIASGKSTVARELARQLERVGVRAAVIDLDLVHDALLADGSTPGDATWQLARRQTATDAKALIGDGVAVVVAEGSFNEPSDRAAFEKELQADAAPVYVTLQVSFNEALRRARPDPTRRTSRDPEFLQTYFASRRDVLAAVPGSDLVIDTERTSAEVAVATIRRRLSLDPRG